MKLIYRGITYEHRSSETPSHSVQKAQPIEVPASLAIHKLIYRGATYYKLSHQGITFLVNACCRRNSNDTSE